ncbi:MAG: nucleotidyltransferase [Lactococcus lactis]|uniref:nucleotidyltransferase domain-containing protein n=1 Tax=Lactococcus lactis subsp. cremoris TaxID=1359 RepID=UPI0021AA9A0C|nr:nucleotidyltransferase [Lactococcus cremoris]MDU1525750.1 nucleotidyltransferase [Lactococcus lactis]MCT4462949.1 nucleotidyltransferase [Lactococcus cremoris]MDU2184487.1 nucleotidyltransferase [Lactococcus lactis]MDU3891355.1 nucleotidyltransferase [Lactococcus lactis]MDU3959251.1 nucleotidyltransferase [Lactococcus lactis]
MEKSTMQLRKILEKIDLTKTQRDRAIEIYTNVCRAIEDKIGFTISFYPQGSFATKTAIRPYKNGRDQAYDVDVICEVNVPKESVTSDTLKGYFRDALENSRYSNNFVEWDKCFTIEFTEQEGVDFSIDIIPSVPEDTATLQQLNYITENPYLVKSSVAIPNRDTWITNNPKGYVLWFENEIIKFHDRYLLKRSENTVSASIEELPEEEFNNNLLSIIKVLKRTRDVFYYRRKSENKPSSIVITTIVGKLAKDLTPTANKLELLIQVVTQLQQIKTYPSNNISKRTNDTGYAISDIITRDMGQWVLNNPANGKDNILSSWNEDENKAKDFFLWIDNLKETFSSLAESTDNQEKSTIEIYNAFAINSPTLDTNKKQFSVTPSSPKPWREK